MRAIGLMFLLSSVLLSAQTTQPSSSSTALSLSSKAELALTGTTVVTDVTVSGSATWSINSSDIESGTFTALAKGFEESKISLQLDRGLRQEAHSGSSGSALGWWEGSDSVVHETAAHNNLSDAIWFFPALSCLGRASSDQYLSYVGQETRDGITVQHLTCYRWSSQLQKSFPTIQALTREDIYLDAQTFLPVAITFHTHADNDEAIKIPVEIRFSDYQPTSGMTVPHHIQKYFNRSLLLDLVISSVSVNSGLQDSAFTLQ